MRQITRITTINIVLELDYVQVQRVFNVFDFRSDAKFNAKIATIAHKQMLIKIVIFHIIRVCNCVYNVIIDASMTVQSSLFYTSAA